MTLMMLTLDVLLANNVCKDTKYFVQALSREQGSLLQIFPFPSALPEPKSISSQTLQQSTCSVSFPYPSPQVNPTYFFLHNSFPSLIFCFVREPKSRSPSLGNHRPTWESREISCKSLPLSLLLNIQFLGFISSFVLEIHLISQWMF